MAFAGKELLLYTVDFYDQYTGTNKYTFTYASHTTTVITVAEADLTTLAAGDVLYFVDGSGVEYYTVVKSANDGANTITVYKDVLTGTDVSASDTITVYKKIGVSGFRSNSFSVNNETVDITHKGSNNWRNLLAGAGIKSFTTSGSGVFINETGEQILNELISTGLYNGSSTYRNSNICYVVDYSSKLGDGSTTPSIYIGDFVITSLEYAGEYNGEQTYSFSLEGSGVLYISNA